MEKLTKILGTGLVFLGISTMGCREFLPQLDEVPRPVEIAMPQKNIAGFLEPANCVEDGEQTYFYCVNHSMPSVFGIYSFDNPIFGKDTGIRVESFDYNLDKQLDFVEIVREDYRDGFKSETIDFKRDASQISEQVFGAIDKLYKEVLLILREEGTNSEEVYNQYKKDIEFLLSVE